MRAPFRYRRTKLRMSYVEARPCVSGSEKGLGETMTDDIDGVTGRDDWVMAKALAYAVTTIDLLPRRWQEASDCRDMKALLLRRSIA